MPPSPAWGFSPGRELRGEKHKRGRSFDGGLLLREKEDDLALFNDMETRERDNFLLESTDDLDDSLSAKLRYFSTFKFGISVPARGESSDLLNADGDKNDYDWLLTPPDTPLFPSLDDEPPPIDIPRRGRPRSQPVSTTRSATTDKSYMTSRGSASPHRRSSSPRSINSISRSRGRPSSASHSSPVAVSRPTTPSRSPSTPQSKPSTPAPRSSTPTLRRPSMGFSDNAASSGRSGTSPVKGSRGNSSSPKMRSWQSNIPGFSSDAPPNLCTSLSDRPASYVRGSSPASRNGRGFSPASSNGRGLSPASGNGRESSAKSGTGRQSMSPTASRSASSSHSHDRDQFSSRSKGSVASSGDDDIDSLTSVSVSVSDRSSARKVNGFSNSRSPGISKKPSRTISSSSAPKRSFDSALRQMDRKNPQKMFRPLLSSVPSTTFYIAKPSSANHPMVSRNSSVVTSSNPSSEQSASVVPDTLGTDHGQDDATEWEKPSYSDAQDGIFILDKVDGMNRGIEHEIHQRKPERCEFEGSTSENKSGESEKFSSHNVGAVSASASESLNIEIIDCHENTPLCSKCGRKLCVMELMEECDGICPACSEKDGCFVPATPGITPVVTHNTTVHSEMTLEEDRSFDELEPELGVPNPTKCAALLLQDEINVEQGQSCLLDSSLARSMVEEGKQHFVDHHQLVGQVRVDFKQDDNDTADQQLQHFNDSECAGISILLNRSSSSKSHVVQGRDFTATNIPYNDLSYARGSGNSLKSSMVHGSFSASSSVDLTSSKQTEAHVKRQLSGKKDDLENSKNDLVSKTRSRGSSFSGNLDHSCQTFLYTREQGKNTETDYTHSSFDRTAVEGNNCCKTMDSSTSEVSSHTRSIRLEDTSEAPIPNDDECVSSGNADEFPYKASEIPDIEAPDVTPESFIDVDEDSTCDSLGMVPGEQENGHERIPDSQTDCSCSSNSKCAMGECNEPSFANSEKDPSACATKSSISHGSHDIFEESTVTVGGQGHEARSLTLEEATDTILFCSSIIHDLAYQAATIGMEKEKSIPLESSRPTVTILGKTNTDRKDTRSRIGSKRPTKSPKARQKRIEVDGKIPSTKIETNKENYESMTLDSLDSAVPNKVDSLKPPKLESKCNCTVM